MISHLAGFVQQDASKRGEVALGLAFIQIARAGPGMETWCYTRSASGLLGQNGCTSVLGLQMAGIHPPVMTGITYTQSPARSGVSRP
jgi:hypothetical protein